jgi:hypothetical protein
MNYFEWWGELDSIEIIFPDRQFNGFFMVEANPVIGWNEYLIAVYLSEHTPRFDFGIARNSWPVASPLMRTFLEAQLPGLVQYLPFRFQRFDGSAQVTGYHVCQFLEHVDCIDRTKTKVRKDWEPINSYGDFATLQPLVLDKRLIGDARLFRIKGCCGTIVIREDLKSLIERAGFKGQRFDLMESTS